MDTGDLKPLQKALDIQSRILKYDPEDNWLITPTHAGQKYHLTIEKENG